MRICLILDNNYNSYIPVLKLLVPKTNIQQNTIITTAIVSPTTASSKYNISRNPMILLLNNINE